MHWRRKWQPTPVFLPGESYGQRNLAGYCPWGHKSQSVFFVTDMLLSGIKILHCCFLFPHWVHLITIITDFFQEPWASESSVFKMPGECFCQYIARSQCQCCILVDWMNLYECLQCAGWETLWPAINNNVSDYDAGQRATQCLIPCKDSS